MRLKHEQIRRVFTDLKMLKKDGIWLSGKEGDGEYKEWFINGTLQRHSFYKDGNRHGEYKIWGNNGKLYLHCFYKDGKRDGEYKEWLSNGELDKHRLYKDDKIIKDYLE